MMGLFIGQVLTPKPNRRKVQLLLIDGAKQMSKIKQMTSNQMNKIKFFMHKHAPTFGMIFVCVMIALGDSF